MAGAPMQGLTGEEAKSRLARDGANAIAEIAEHPLRRVIGKLSAPVPWMLEAAIVLQLFLGDYAEAGVVAFLLVFNALLAWVQEGRAQATLAALRSRLALFAAVQRDGHWTRVPAATLVAGDLVKLSLGTIVAADVRLSDGQVLLDQSMLTGESLPVEAAAGALACAGALVRRGEAVGIVSATGERTRFGRTAELVRTAGAESSEQTAILRVVRNLAMFNGGVTVLLALYALKLGMPRADLIALVLVAVLSAIPVALPSMFTLAAAVGARALARTGVLPTNLAAVDEAGGIGVLCADKTGTLTRNELTVVAVRPMPGFDEAHVLALAALASSEGGQDLVDAAIRAAASRQPVGDAPELVTFIPFDPALKRAEATLRRADGSPVRVAKGAFEVIEGLAQTPPAAGPAVAALQAQGFRVLAVAAGPPEALRMAGFIALSDPPREDSAALIAELAGLGVRTVMVTGDARITAEFVARKIGITGPSWVGDALPEGAEAARYAIFSGVLPEDKYRLVKALQAGGHVVGMCGDGANDAPALRQAQMGIAVSTATDVAKSAAGLVLTEPGLGGVVAAVKEGRATYQRVFTYALRSIAHKVVQVLFLGFGLILTGQAILTPMLMVLMMISGDFLAMSSSTDNVRPSPRPSVWQIGRLTLAGIGLGVCDLVFCMASLATGKYWLGLDARTLPSLAVVTLVFASQALFYVARERRHIWSSRPGKWLVVTSVADISFIGFLAVNGVLMRPLAISVLAGLLVAAMVFAFALDGVKLVLFRWLWIA